MKKIHLSVVAGSRNDDHGGNLLYRMQHFASGFIEQCKRHDLSAELILVDWNPPDEKESLSKALNFPKEKGPCHVRIITVPKKLHETLNHANELPMFQMLAKNVGIRRAKGEYILSTNIDILFSDNLTMFLRDELKPGFCYRVDRLDVPTELPKTHSLDEILTFCNHRYFRINGRHGTQILEKGKWTFIDTSLARYSQKFPLLKNHIWSFYLRKILLLFNKENKPYDLDYLKYLARKIKYRPFTNVHTNACGDFTLLTRDHWESLRGYYEFQGFSWHLDSLLLYQARLLGIQSKDLPQEMPIYHIEHGKGSGYNPENHDLVFDRIKAKGIPYLSDQGLLNLVREMKKRKTYTYNDRKWGFAEHEFEEVIL